MATENPEQICRIEFNRYRAAMADSDAALAFWRRRLEAGLSQLDAARVILSAALDDVRRRQGSAK